VALHRCQLSLDYWAVWRSPPAPICGRPTADTNTELLAELIDIRRDLSVEIRFGARRHSRRHYSRSGLGRACRRSPSPSALCCHKTVLGGRPKQGNGQAFSAQSHDARRHCQPLTCSCSKTIGAIFRPALCDPWSHCPPATAETGLRLCQPTAHPDGKWVCLKNGGIFLGMWAPHYLISRFLDGIYGSFRPAPIGQRHCHPGHSRLIIPALAEWLLGRR